MSHAFSVFRWLRFHDVASFSTPVLDHFSLLFLITASISSRRPCSSRWLFKARSNCTHVKKESSTLSALVRFASLAWSRACFSLSACRCASSALCFSRSAARLASLACIWRYSCVLRADSAARSFIFCRAVSSFSSFALSSAHSCPAVRSFLSLQ